MTSATVENLSQVIVAKYLAKYGYDAALSNFLKESGLARSAVDLNNDAFEELETIVGERIEFNESKMAAKLADLSLNDSIPSLDPKFRLSPWDHTLKLVAADMPEKPASLVVDLAFSASSELSVSTVDRSVYFYESDLNLKKKLKLTSGVVKRCGTILRDKKSWFFVCGMNGALTIFDESFKTLLEHLLHSRIVKYIDFFHLESESKCYSFSCGLDNYVKVHLIDLKTSETVLLDSQKLTTPCTSFQLAQTPDQRPVLLLTQQDHSQLMIYTLWDDVLVETHKLAMNNAKFTSHSFNVQSSCLLDFKETASIPYNSLNPHLTVVEEGVMMAIATSHTPYMRLILLEIPGVPTSKPPSESATRIHYDKILRNIATVVPQDSFSQSILKTCHSSKGLIVGNDSGVFAIDLANSDSWSLFQQARRVKALDTSQNRLTIAYADTGLDIFHWRQ
ncbi:LAME_0F09362g1_1 [Lachancea meyersii CBS 8951]|uniref:LAME_0F09362g1_1 n=1 Tax=Lachancea meyersii CBS 8951 TaxID=1266667 RepID=A0A1G4JUY0_9SACH|nr:LAME_0F09362g1_1 [Lachancea meyersii CBS 8951]